MNKLIYCSTVSGGIGFENTIPWHSPEDFKYFKNYTLDSTVIMGYNTWMSLPTKPLPNRRNIVVSDSPIDGVEVISEDRMFEMLNDDNDYIIIGGAYIYEKALPYVDEISHTVIYGNYECDRFFRPDMKEFGLKSSHMISHDALVNIFRKK